MNEVSLLQSLGQVSVAEAGEIFRDFLRGHVREMIYEVANRPGRLEPRVLKRRRHGYKLMQEPRTVLRSKLRKKCT